MVFLFDFRASNQTRRLLPQRGELRSKFSGKMSKKYAMGVYLLYVKHSIYMDVVSLEAICGVCIAIFYY